ncbi:hypothetical protein [Oryzibacter oryziterrae]|uniref:hypothetical protein n=1 Tax=Oryzibacter oryziterrae TaxID=2766474 RepID=UPI001F362D6C|nr:hypothetical protein [Oryzibacter oryziterrae]
MFGKLVTAAVLIVATATSSQAACSLTNATGKWSVTWLQYEPVSAGENYMSPTGAVCTGTISAKSATVATLTTTCRSGDKQTGTLKLVNKNTCSVTVGDSKGHFDSSMQMFILNTKGDSLIGNKMF